MPAFFAVQKKRQKSLKKMQSDIDKINVRITDLQCIMEKKNFAIAKKTFSILEEARTKSLKEIQVVTDELSGSLYQRGKEKEEDYQRMCSVAQVEFDQYSWSDLAQRFMDAMEKDNV